MLLKMERSVRSTDQWRSLVTGVSCSVVCVCRTGVYEDVLDTGARRVHVFATLRSVMLITIEIKKGREQTYGRMRELLRQCSV